MMTATISTGVGKRFPFAARIQATYTCSSFEHIRAEAKRLRAESQHLQLNLLQSLLDLGCTFATLVPGTDYDPLREMCHRNALKACNDVRRILAKGSLEPTSATTLQARLEQLESSLSSSHSGEKHTAKGAEGPVTEYKCLFAIAPVRDAHQNGPMPLNLTTREVEVLRHIAEGHSTKQIAYLMTISFKTAACHRSHIMDKLEIHEVAGLVRYAIRNGLVQA